MNEIEIHIENEEESDGSWTLNSNQNVPAIIRWKCPVCGYENVRDCRYETFSSPPLNNGFIISLLCDGRGCGYQRAVELKIKMSLHLESVLPQTVEEFEEMEKQYKISKKGASIRDLLRAGKHALRSSSFIK